MDDFAQEMVECARQLSDYHKQSLLEFARTSNPDAAVMPQIMVSDFSPRNYMKADIYLTASYARGYVVLKRHKSGEGYGWLVSDGYSCFIDLGLVAASMSEAKTMFSGFFKGNKDAEIFGPSRWYKGLV